MDSCILATASARESPVNRRAGVPTPIGTANLLISRVRVVDAYLQKVTETHLRAKFSDLDLAFKLPEVRLAGILMQRCVTLTGPIVRTGRRLRFD